jgi:hypothetical protein
VAKHPSHDQVRQGEYRHLAAVAQYEHRLPSVQQVQHEVVVLEIL